MIILVVVERSSTTVAEVVSGISLVVDIGEDSKREVLLEPECP